jgi:hypothetical protein
MAQYGAFFSLETMGDTSPTVIEHYNQTQGNAHKGDEACTKVPTGGVSQSRLSHGLTLFVRVARVQGQIERLHPVSDADLLQHAADLTGLMEQAYATYEASGDLGAYEHSRKYLKQRDAARRLLSREWQQRRDEQILAGCSAAYFVDMGDKDRAQIAANEGKAEA